MDALSLGATLAGTLGYRYTPCFILLFTVLREDGLYPYTNDLVALEACRDPESGPLPARWCRVTTPLNLHAWTVCLADHPDKQFVAYILHGIACGFSIGFQGKGNLKARRRNMGSASQNPAVVDA